MTNTQYRLYQEEKGRIREHHHSTCLMSAEKAFPCIYMLTERAEKQLCQRDKAALRELASEYAHIRQRDMHWQSYINGEWLNSPYGGDPAIADKAMEIMKSGRELPRRWIWMHEKSNYRQ